MYVYVVFSAMHVVPFAVKVVLRKANGGEFIGESLQRQFRQANP